MDKFFDGMNKGKPTTSKSSGDKPEGSSSTTGAVEQGQKLPSGVVLGKDGKPCRSCTSVRDWMAMAKAESAPRSTSTSPALSSTSSATSSAASSATSASADIYPTDCPPDVERLGNHTWTLLHSLTASYPPSASPRQQSDMRTFLGLFAKLYPCWVCAEDLDKWMDTPRGKPRLEGRGEFGTWMCEAHNEVNRKLGKVEFDCKMWEERWRKGWEDGRCG